MRRRRDQTVEGEIILRTFETGTVVVSIIGQVPFEFTGIVKEDDDGT